MIVGFWKNLVRALPAVLCAGWAACGDADQPSRRAERPTVFVSIEPLRYFAESIGGDLIEVQVLVAPGQSPATYEPTTRQMTRLAQAELFFVVGVPMEKPLMPRIRRSFPEVRIVDTRAGMELVPVAGTLRASGDHGHPHSEFDPHVWLDPARARVMADNVLRALADIAPAHTSELSRNHRVLDEELSALQQEVAAILAPVRGKEMVVFHPAYGYFAEAFGLKQVAIEAGGVTPGSRHLSDIIQFARERKVRAIFIQPQFSSATAAAVAAEVGAVLVTLDPLAADYPANMRKMAASIHDALANE